MKYSVWLILGMLVGCAAQQHKEDMAVYQSYLDEKQAKRERAERDQQPDRRIARLKGRAVWDDCIRAFVQSQPDNARDKWLDALSQFTAGCDKIEQTAGFFAPNHDPRLSYVTFNGILAPKMNIRMRVSYVGSDWIFATDIKLAIDELRWSPPEKLHFHQDSVGGYVSESTNIEITAETLPIIERLVASKEAIVRLEGKGIRDVVVTDEMKQNMRLMLEAFKLAGYPGSPTPQVPTPGTSPQ